MDVEGVSGSDPGDLTRWSENGADEVLAFLAGDALTLQHKRVAVVSEEGGDLSVDLARKGAPTELIDFARAPSVPEGESPGYSGKGSRPPGGVRVIVTPTPPLPSPGHQFDVVVVWRSLERRPETVAWCRELGRIVSPTGVIALSIDLRDEVLGGRHRSNAEAEEGSPQAADLTAVPHALTLDDVQRGLLAGGLVITKVEIQSQLVALPASRAHAALARECMTSARLLAVPTGQSLPTVRSRLGNRLRSIVSPAPNPNVESNTDQVSPSAPSYDWIHAHCTEAADRILAFLDESGVALAGLRVADVGCGDGLIDLGVSLRGAPSELTGFDLKPTDSAQLLSWARDAGIASALPGGLRFVTSGVNHIPAPSGCFDVVFSWSAFEHVSDPVAMAAEIRRVLRPDGVVMVQLWPFFFSEHGSHMARWYPQGFAHLLRPMAQLRREVGTGSLPLDPEVQAVVDAYLNRSTLGDLQRALLSGGLHITRAELVVDPFHIPLELAHESVTELAVGGVLLLAKPARPPVGAENGASGT